LGRVQDRAGLGLNASHAQYVPQLGRGGCQKAVFLLVVHEAKAREVGSAFAIDLRRDGYVVASENDLLGLHDPFFEQRRGDRALVYIEEGDVVIGDLMQEDDELDEVGVRLLPEGFLASAKKVVQKRSDVVCEGVGVEVVVKRVVAVLGIEADFDVIFGPLVTGEDVFYLAAKIAFHLKDQPADAPLFVGGFVGQNLLGERKHAATRLPTRANEVWTMDYTHDELAGGRKFRTLNLMDGYTREALRIEPDTSLPGLRVVRILDSLRERRGTPATIQVDNGTEFTSRVVDQWAHQNQVALHFIERGKPTQNALIESFNGKFRDECLNQNWFVNLRDAREVIEAWRVDYNTVRPHSSLRYLTPEEFAESVAARPASPPTPVVSIDPAWAGSDVQEPESANL
jgi:hypothetical protein